MGVGLTGGCTEGRTMMVKYFCGGVSGSPCGLSGLACGYEGRRYEWRGSLMVRG